MANLGYTEKNYLKQITEQKQDEQALMHYPPKLEIPPSTGWGSLCTGRGCCL